MQAHPSSDRRWRTAAAIAVLAAFLSACATSSAFRNGKRAEQNDNFRMAPGGDPDADVYGVIARVRQDTYLVYEPLLLLAGVYMCLTGILVVLVRLLERRIPVRGA